MSKPDDGKIHTPWKLCNEWLHEVSVMDSRKNEVLKQTPYHCKFPGINKLSHIVDCVNACAGLDPKHVAELLSNCEELTRKIDALGYSKSDNMQVKELLDLIDYYLDTPVKKVRRQ